MTDQRLERIVGQLLRTGVLMAAAVVLAGGVWWLAEVGSHVPTYQRFSLEQPELRNFPALLRSIAHPSPDTVIQLGLLILIATPIARVVMAMAGFALERDHTYVAVCVVVLVVLIYSLVLPFGAGESPHSTPSHSTGLRNVPMPSISTSTTSPAESGFVAPGVPVKMRSPGSNVTHRLIQLTMVAQSKIKSAVRSF